MLEDRSTWLNIVVTASETKVYVQPEFVGRRKQTESLAKMAMSLSHNQPDLQNWRDCFLITNLIPLLRLTVLGCENEVRSGSARCAWAIFFCCGPRWWCDFRVGSVSCRFRTGKKIRMSPLFLPLLLLMERRKGIVHKYPTYQQKMYGT